MLVQWNAYPSPLGPLTMVEGPEGPLIVEFPRRAAQLLWAERLRARRPECAIEFGPCRRATALLEAYFAGRAEPFQYPDYLDRWLAVSSEEQSVWSALCDIPFGETRAYDDIARATGLHPRRVGQLNGANQLAVLIPCHRVVGKHGTLVGYGGGLARKRWLLDHELRSGGLVLR